MVSLVLEDVTVEVPNVRAISRSAKMTLIRKVSGVPAPLHSMKVRSRLIDGISFSLEAGDRLGIVGPNGAGKTTLLRTIAGIFEPTHGKIFSSGHIVPIMNRAIGMSHEATGRENVHSQCLLLGLRKSQIESRMDEILDFTELGEYVDRPVYTYSDGMMMRLSFAICTAIEPDILLLDEWLSVADTAFREKAEARMVQLVENSKILIIASHSEELIERMTNLRATLDRGKIVQFERTGERG